MSKWRQQYLRRLIAWHFTNTLEDLYCTEKITLEERNLIYYELGTRLNLRDVLPSGPAFKYPDPDELKEQIRKRLACKSSRYVDLKLIRKY